jgi:hypothetical protein
MERAWSNNQLNWIVPDTTKSQSGSIVIRWSPTARGAPTIVMKGREVTPVLSLLVLVGHKHVPSSSETFLVLLKHLNKFQTWIEHGGRWFGGVLSTITPGYCTGILVL